MRWKNLRRHWKQLWGQKEKKQEKEKKEPPGWVKANTPKGEAEKKPRRIRKAEHNRGRRREEPTRIMEHEWEVLYRFRLKLRRGSLSLLPQAS